MSDAMRVALTPRTRRATLLASVAVLAPLTVAKLVEYALKASNPDRVDITQGLAYLRPILITVWTLLAIGIGSATWAILDVRRKDGPTAARIPMLVLLGQIALGLVFALGINLVSGLTE